MIIRSIAENDLVDLNCLHESLFKQPFEFIDYIKDKPFHYGIVLEKDGAVIGYLVGQIIFEMADLYYVAIHPEYRGNQFGKRLVEKFIEDTKVNGGEKISLEVRVSNQSAISLYEKFEFIKIGTRRRYYADGEDALLMNRNLL